MSATVWRGSVFLGSLLLLALAGWRWPRHRGDPARRSRWPVNLGFGVAGTLCLRLLLPRLAIEAALRGQQHRFGLLHAWPLPG